jgi:hypothetical protein
MTGESWNMAAHPHDDDDGARGRELEMIRELAQIVNWRPSQGPPAPDKRSAGGEPWPIAGQGEPDDGR